METTPIVFTIFLIALAAVAFFVLKKVVKMAIRAAIVVIILLIAIVGGISLWMFGTGKNPPSNRPANVKPVR